MDILCAENGLTYFEVIFALLIALTAFSVLSAVTIIVLLVRSKSKTNDTPAYSAAVSPVKSASNDEELVAVITAAITAVYETEKPANAAHTGDDYIAAPFIIKSIKKR